MVAENVSAIVTIEQIDDGVADLAGTKKNQTGLHESLSNDVR